jgi:multiple sugar transport system substrate-binding protein
MKQSKMKLASLRAWPAGSHNRASKQRITPRLCRRFAVGGFSALVGIAGLVPGAIRVAGAQTHATSAALTGTITAEFDAGLTFDSNALGVSWWNNVASEFHKKYPHATLKLVNISGNLAAYTTKLALQFRTPASAPDVIQINSQYLGEFAAAGDLLSLNRYVARGEVPGWASYPANVKADDTFNGTVFGIDEGENIGALIFNKSMLQKAGVKLPWKPTTWAQIISAAEAVKAHDPGVYPLGIAAGTATAAGGIAQGTGHLIYGSSTPTIYDGTKHRWVVSSPGLSQVMSFYRSVFGDGLGVPVSYLFESNAIGELPTLMSEGKLAIAIGENWYPGAFALKGTGETWPAAKKVVGAAPIPTRTGQAPGSASALQAWAVAVSKGSKQTALDLGLVKIMQGNTNIVSMANTAGFVPPEPSLAHAPAFVHLAPLQSVIAGYLSVAKPLPSYEPGYAAWVDGIEQATAKLASDPKGTTVAAALALVKSTVSAQLGASKVEVLP